MPQKYDLNAKENAEVKAFVYNAGTGNYRSEDLDVDSIDAILRNAFMRKTVVISYLLNRVHVWLRETEPKFIGDDKLDVKWASGNNNVFSSLGNNLVSCVITDKATQDSWKIEWGKKYNTDSILVYSTYDGKEKIMLDGSFYERKSSENPKDKDLVTGHLEYPFVFDDVIKFSQAIKNSMPEDIRNYNIKDKGNSPVQNEFKFQMSFLEVALMFDDYLPGNVFKENINTAATKANKAVTTYVKNNFDKIIKKLEDENYTWGTDCVSIGDQDAVSCVIRNENAIGIFYADYATTAEENIGAIIVRNGVEKNLEVYTFTEYDGVMKALNQEIQPQHVTNLSDMSSETIKTDEGQSAFQAMSWWFINLDHINIKDHEKSSSSINDYWKNASDTGYTSIK